jgi:uncharacterized protein (TIGR02569 family)
MSGPPASVPPASVLEAFGVRAPSEPLEGGEGRSLRAGDLVLKPAPSATEWAWLGEHLPMVRGDGFRLALPVPAVDGRWVVRGWCAQTWVTGAHPNPPRWLDVLAVCDRLHTAMRHLERPAFLDERTHPWAVGDRVAWEELAPDVEHPLLDRLLVARRAVDLPPQAVHGDLTENVLFARGRPPAVIDVSLYWRPSGYAHAIVVGDAVRWMHAEPASLLAAVEHVPAFPQLFVRASIFRLVTTLLFGGDAEPYERDLEIVGLLDA